ncbi:MAG TPA: M20/M25/M40 family metallo-hydrolase [Thermoanaerobaculia bacterium]|nr:M20/M25/M40 family metallo-hydrolase [Thermoanaerobaculia bacterium]
MRRIAGALVLILSAAAFAETPDLQMQSRIRQEGFRNSKVMEIASELLDEVGARLTGSPNMKRANEWTRDKLTSFGLSNARLEGWGPFGRGWSYESVSVRMLAPEVAQLSALPKAWAPGTNGPIRGTPFKIKLETKEDLEKAKGKLAGKIVMTSEPRELRVHDKAALSRYDEAGLASLSRYEVPRSRGTPEEFVRRREFRREFAKFLTEEKALAVMEQGSHDGGLFIVQSAGSQKPEDPTPVPTVTLSAEHYQRIARLLDRKKDVVIELDVKARFHDEDRMAYNTVAEIPGTDKSGEVVMLGAHLDSWHGGTGATDNGAGVVAAMEAVRILKAIGVAPRRTIRIALWSGEEQGLLGSRAYVAQHFGSRPEPTDPKERDLPASMRREKRPLNLKPDHSRLSAYFNMDNGTGRIRGIYAQENVAAGKIFESWLDAVRDLGTTNVTMRNTGSTDHIAFDDVGLPGFQFIQDAVEYDTRTHHTNYDTYERLQRDDLMQAAVVMATFVWETANRREMMPRKALAKEDVAPAPQAAAGRGRRGTR